MEKEKILKQLKVDIILAKHEFNIYKQLFSKNEKTIELLEKVASNFFRDIQEILWDRILLNLAKLTDPAESGRYKNLSLERLKTLVERLCCTANK